MYKLRSYFLVLIALILTACAATTQITTVQPGATVALTASARESKLAQNQAAATGSPPPSANTATPREETLPTTTFGRYPFRAEASGAAPFYGLLPLKFNGGHLVLDILLFAPGAFFNLREVYPYYELDVVGKQVKYKKSADDAWQVYMPPADEEAAVKAIFDAKK